MNEEALARLRRAINVDGATVKTVEDQLRSVLSVGAVRAKIGMTGTEDAAASGASAPPAQDAPEAEQAVEAEEVQPSTRRAAASSRKRDGGELGDSPPSPNLRNLAPSRSPRRRQWEQ